MACVVALGGSTSGRVGKEAVMTQALQRRQQQQQQPCQLLKGFTGCVVTLVFVREHAVLLSRV
jgi:hypothetical protein